MSNVATRRAVMCFIVAASAACDGSTSPPAPTQVQSASAVQQGAIVGTAVTELPGVRVTTASGAAAPGVEVTFVHVSGGGTITGEVQVTDATGVARLLSWTLGTVAGENMVRASAAGVAGTVEFRATGSPDVPASLEILTPPPATATSGTLLSPQPAVRLRDRHGNVATTPGVRVTAASLAPGVQLEDAVAVSDSLGVARYTWLTPFGATGQFTLSFSATGLGSVEAGAATALVEPPEGTCASPVPLDMALGEMRRVTLNSSRGLWCFDFDRARNDGQQFLLMLENLPLYGTYGTSLFPPPPGMSLSPRAFSYTLRATPHGVAAAPAPFVVQRSFGPVAPQQALHSWDFGAGRIYEHRPEILSDGVPDPWFRSASGQVMSTASTSLAPQVGDTIHGIRMEGIARLGIPSGDQSAIVRHVSAELIIAEDVRLTTTLRRQSGSFNTPLHADTMRAIAEQYASLVRAQGDMLFDGRHNAAVENANAGRVLAVHSLTYADNVWGYTYSSGSYFVWDYWVGSADGSTGTLNQHVQRNTDNLFMHEIAHMREVGLLQREGVFNRRGHQWFVEGFARFSERLPIAARLLGTATPSRTGNVVLPYNPAFGSSFFRDDVPTYLSVGSNMLEGYDRSSFVFDYFADQVALRGGDWLQAVRELVVTAGRPLELDQTVDRWVGGTLGELFTRARLALYLDDIGTPGLPAWTQYQQFQLRASRPVSSSTDPRDSWPRLVPGTASEISHEVPAGGAWGYLIDGRQPAAGSTYQVIGPKEHNAVMSITRIR